MTASARPAAAPPAPDPPAPRPPRRRSGIAILGSDSLPADMLALAARRVAAAATVFASLSAIALLVNNILLHDYMGTMPGLEAFPWPGNFIGLSTIAVSLLMVWIARRMSDRPGLLLDIGLVYLIVVCALVAVLVQYRPAIAPLRVSWLCIAILLYPSIAPNTPARTLAAAIVAASMDPLFFLFAKSRGHAEHIQSVQLMWMFLPNYLSAAASTVSATVIRGLGQQVKAARELGSYRLGPKIGAGGMGDVHRAEHRLLARPAAIKLIRPELLARGTSRSVTLERFRREAAAAALLRSPHTIALYDYGVTPDGTFYYAMELLDGASFDELIARFGPVPAPRAIHLMVQACESIAEAHARGLIHRDLKPANLFTTRQGLQVDFVKVLDFGLVKFHDPASDRPATITAPEIATGTPAFMAPEAALGERTADHRIDIYSLGCVLYWLLTGELVFEGSSPMKVMTRHISDPVVPPSKRTELPVPPELDAVVLACLAKRADDRPATALELAERLQAVAAAPGWTTALARRWWDTHLPETPPPGGDECNEGTIHKQMPAE